MPPGTIAVAGSIATDHLMRYPGLVSDQLIDGHVRTHFYTFGNITATSAWARDYRTVSRSGARH